MILKKVRKSRWLSCVLALSLILQSLVYVPVLAADVSAPVNLQVPALSTEDTSIVLVWEKPDYYDNIDYFNVYMDGEYIGNTDYTSYENEDSRAFQNISAFYKNVDTNNYHTKILVHNYTVTGLAPETTYTFHVTSVGAGSESAASNIVVQTTTATPATVDIAALGAQEGNDDAYGPANTKIIQDAINVLPENGRLVIPEGVWVTGALWLKSNMTLDIQGTLLGSTDPDLYPNNFWLYDYSTDERGYSLLNAHTYDYGTLQNIRIVGNGVIDSNGWVKDSSKNRQDLLGNQLTGYHAGSNSNFGTGGSNYLAYKQSYAFRALGATAAQGYATRSNIATFRGVDGMYVEGITIRNPSFHGFVFLHSENIVVNNTINDTFDCNNGDGFEFGDTQNIMVFNNFVHTGDDCINFASGMGQAAAEKTPTGDAWIFNNFLYEGHGGVVAGSHTGGIIQNILAEDNVLYYTDTGLRCKTNTPMGGGARNIIFRDNALDNIDGDAAFIFTSSYSDANATIAYEPAKDISYFRDIMVKNCTVQNYRGSASASKGPIVIIGNGNTGEVYHENITFEDVKISVSGNQYANITYANNVAFKNVQVINGSASDFWNISNARNISFENSTMTSKASNAQQAPEWPDNAQITLGTVAGASIQLELADLESADYGDVDAEDSLEVIEEETQDIDVDAEEPFEEENHNDADDIFTDIEPEESAEDAGKLYLSNNIGVGVGTYEITYAEIEIEGEESQENENEEKDPMDSWEEQKDAQPEAELLLNQLDAADDINGLYSAALFWDAATDNMGVSRYVVFVNGVDLGASNKSTSTNSITLTGLSPFRENYVEVYAEDATGARTATPLTYTIPRYKEDNSGIEGPALPANKTITGDGVPGFTWNSLSWTQPSDAAYGIEYYNIYLQNLNTGNTDVIEAYVNDLKLFTVKNATTHQYLLTGLEMSTDYSVTMKAVNFAGVESEDAYGPLVFNTRNAYAKGVPYWEGNEELTVTVTENKDGTTGNISLSWSPANVEEAQTVAGYRVYLNGIGLKRNAGNEDFNPANDTYTTSGTSYTIQDVDLTEDIEIAVYPGAYHERLSIRGDAASVASYVPVLAYRWGNSPLTYNRTGVSADNLALKLDWHYRSFGQSTDIKFNNVANAPGQNGINYAWVNPEWDYQSALYIQSAADIEGAVKYGEAVKLDKEDVIVVESRGGKIANGHDGITYFYTTMPTDRNFIMSALVTVEAYGPHPNNENGATSPNGQSGAGMMVRDSLGDHRQEPALDGFEELPAASNFAAAAFTSSLSAGTMYRDGVVSPVSSIGISYAGTRNYRLTQGAAYLYQLERCDDGFYVTIFDETGAETLFARRKAGDADLVMRINEEEMYLGFFASREDRLSIREVKIYDTGDANFVPTVPPVASAPNPALTVKSPTAYYGEDYTFTLVANYDGDITIESGGQVLLDTPINRYDELYYETKLSAGSNAYTVTYVPTSSDAPNNNTITRTHNVTYTESPTSHLDAIYVSPAGNGDGTYDNPTSLNTAISRALPGQTIYLFGGTYTSSVSIGNTLGGLPDKYKTLRPVEGETVNFRTTISLAADYWHFYGFTAGGTESTRTSTPINITGNYNIMELLVTEYANNTGLNISGSGIDPDAWPKYNKIINCTSRYNVDAAGNNADGFGAKRVSYGNMFYGCVAYGNVDDGYDFFNWIDSGSSRPITMINCVAYGNDHNGFKLGGESQPADHIVIDSLAFNNIMAGFSDNFNPGAIQITNCISVDNGDQNFLMRDNTYFEPGNKVLDSISYRTDATNGLNDHISGDASYTATYANGISAIDDYVLSDADFVSVQAPDIIERDEDGEIIWGDFMRLKVSSPLVHAGSDGENIGISGYVEDEAEVVEVESIKINSAAITVIAKNNAIKLTATVSPADATNPDIMWTSSNSGIATVAQDGFVRAVSPGMITITATAQNGVKSQIILRVTL